MDSETPVRYVSRCTIKPHQISKETQQTGYLTPWALHLLSAQDIQFGLLFAKPPPISDDVDPMVAVVDQLKHSLSLALSIFFPVWGRLMTNKQDNPPSYSVSLDCSNSVSQGVEFVHTAAVATTIDDILSPLYVPAIVKSFFAFTDGTMINHDGHTLPLLGVQVTELVDGIFVSFCFNHVVVDGTSFWHFFNAWAEIHRSNGNTECISRPPITKRWFPEELKDHNINLPFSHHDEFIERHTPPPLTDRVFHFSAQSMARLRAQANDECGTNKISSFQALSALLWRSMTRARCVQMEQETYCHLYINDRIRLSPPLSNDYFGCYIEVVSGVTKAAELLGHDLGWAAWLMHEAVANRTDREVRGWLKDWMKDPSFFQVGPFYESATLVIGNSPRFDVYGCDFGWGKALAIRSGWTYKFSGNVWAHPGREGGGSVDIEISLSPEAMSALESDEEFMNAL